MKGTLWAFAGQGTRIVIQASYFLLIARLLGVRGYGAFVSITALFAICAPFANLGAGNLLIQRVASEPERFGHHWKTALATSLSVGAGFVVLVSGLAILLLPPEISFTAIICVALSELVFARLSELASQAFQAVDDMARSALLLTLLNATRLAGAGLLWLAHVRISVEQWTLVFLVGSGLTAAYGFWLVSRRLGRPSGQVRFSWSNAKEGLYFSVLLSAYTINNDVDKTLLARLSTLEAAGIYASAYRIIEVSFTPVRSLLQASYAGFFREGRSGIEGTLRFARRLAPYSLGGGLLAAFLILVFSPLVPIFIGEEFAGAVSTLRWLSIIPLLKSLHHLAGDTLTGALLQGRRSAVQVGIAIFNIVANIILIPRYSWFGAVIASILSDGLMAVLMWCMAWISVRSQRKESPPCPA